MFKNKSNPYITRGVNGEVDIRLQLLMWSIIDNLNKKGKPSRVHDGGFPLTGILRCPKCGAGMVISRTTNKLEDGNKKSIAYYAFENWKNKGTAVCTSNSIRIEKANEYVFSKLSELLSNDNMIKTIVSNINKERIRKVGFLKPMKMK